jgi:hypothetical protein
MNVLLFVTSFLLILSMLTYAKIDNFRYFVATEAQFEYYMNNLENAYGNAAAKRWYDTTIAKRQNSSPQDKQGSTGSPRLGFKILIDPQMQQKEPLAYQQTLAWTKQLMHNLYGKYAFFKDALEKRPSFIDELLDHLKRAVEELPEERRPKEASDLANLNVGPELQNIFYLMLKGCPIDGAKDQQSQALKHKERPTLKLPSPEDMGDDEHDTALAAMEGPSKEGYDSLLNYINLNNTTKLRVYLAPKEVLGVAFGSDTADTIIATRAQLYQSIVRGDTTPQQATAQFKSLFESYIRGSDTQMLDFKVSKTNPSNYN